MMSLEGCDIRTCMYVHILNCDKMVVTYVRAVYRGIKTLQIHVLCIIDIQYHLKYVYVLYFLILLF